MCYNGVLALWHLRCITKLKAGIISCRCTAGKRGRRGGGGGGGIMGGRIMSVCWREEEGGRGRSPAAANA